MENKNGLHILLDIHGVSFSCLKEKDIPTYFMKMVESSGLQALGHYYHSFDDDTFAFTLCIVLAESHFSLHTWPEKNYISADIFVSNYGSDNTTKANYLKESLLKLLHNPSIKLKEQIIYR